MKFPRQQSEEISINLTPLIDVVFLLLIFFMVSTTFTRESRLDVALPEASATASAVEGIEIVITSDGKYRVNDRPLVNTQAKTLHGALVEVAGQDRAQPLKITADGTTPHQAVVTAMDVAAALGFNHLSITTQESK